MKTSLPTLTLILSVTMSLNVFAQHRSRGNEPQQQLQQYNPQNQGNVQANNRQGPNINQRNNHGGYVTIQIGNYPNYGGGNYYHPYQYPNYGYTNYYSQLMRNARISIRQSAQVIGDALQFSDWNDLYSPWLAKAIRHQQYAKQLYAFGDYAGAMNHAERAGFLAWNTLTYFNNGMSNNGSYGNPNTFPNPYSDPNNPYYRQGNPAVQPDNYTTTGEDDYSGYKKASPAQSQIVDSARIEKNVQAQPGLAKFSKMEIDGSLPQSTLSDRDVLKTNRKDLDVE